MLSFLLIVFSFFLMEFHLVLRTIVIRLYNSALGYSIQSILAQDEIFAEIER